jgi:hypothetical protein
MSVEAAAHDRAKYLLTIKRNERSPSREIAAHNQRNVHSWFGGLDLCFSRIGRALPGNPPVCAKSIYNSPCSNWLVLKETAIFRINLIHYR